MASLISNFFRILGRNLYRFHGMRAPIGLIGLNLFNIFLFKNSSIQLKSVQVSPTNFQLQNFTDELFEKKKNNQDIIILINNDYNQEFTKKLNNILSFLAFQSKQGQRNERNLVIMTMRFDSEAERKAFKQKYNIEFSDETIFLLKNRFQNKLVPFTFENIIYNPQLLNVYFRGVPIFNQKYKANLEQRLEELDKNKTLIIYYLTNQNQKYDQHERQFKKQQLQITDRYPQMIPIIINNKQDLKYFGLQDVQEGSYHLLKKHSKKYSIVEPNLQIFNKNYRLVKNVHLYDEKGNFLIPYYIYSTNLSTKLYSSYNLEVTINKNQISKKQKNAILETLRTIKTKYQFNDINFQIKFANIKEINKPWMIKIFNNKDEQQHLLAADKNPPTQKKQVHSYEYLYDKNEVNEEAMVKFIQDVKNHQFPEYFRSEQAKLISNINRLTANSFNQKVKNNNKNQLVFQYSTYGCKAIYPLIYNFYKNNPNKNIQVYRLNSIKNMIQGESMIPCVLFYKNGWKNYPMQVPANVLMRQNGLSDFCEIFAEVDSLDKKKLEDHFGNNQNIEWNIKSENVHK